MIKRIVAVTVAVGALAVPAVVSGAQTSDPAAQCLRAHDPAATPRAFAACVRGKAAAQPSDSSNPAARCLQEIDPAVRPQDFGECVRDEAGA